MLNLKEMVKKQLRQMSTQTYIIYSQDLDRMISDGEIANYLIIDIREEKLYQNFHFPNSINIPYRKLGKKLASLSVDKKILIICNSGFTAAQSVSLLNSIGFKAFILEKGINGYLEEGQYINTILRSA